MVLERVKGNLLDATEQYIAHQCNCTSTTAKGLAATLFRRYPYADIYRERRPQASSHIFSKNATLDPKVNATDSPYTKRTPQNGTHDTPGTMVVCGNGTPDERWIIHMMAQIGPGKPSSGARRKGDSAKDREQYFAACLHAVKEQLGPQLTSIAFPSRIGCGMAGGNWAVYERMLEEWAASLLSVRVVLYEL
jgi:O-acetyl-ADP-ribose deacetylase (regulator of RNase III)